MKKISTVEARNNFAEIINLVSYGKERIILTRRGRPVAAVIPINDLKILEDLKNEAEV